LHRRLIAAALLAAAAAGLACLALNSQEASARPGQGTPPCSEPALTKRTDPQPRPSLAGARQLAGTRVVVHYAASGAATPPRADRTPANGIPDYVEKIRNAADAALAFFGRPTFQGVPFQGFDTTFADTAGPDARLDIYLTGRGRALGRAVPPTRGVGGAFLELSTGLADRPRGSPKRFSGDGIRFTVAHELFHIVQFGYVPSGMPLWIAEGTANSLAFLFEKADHPVLTTDADAWLRRPDCALWYEGFNCERCYGGVWWWVTKRESLRLFFDYLAAHARDPIGVRQGVGALEAALEALTPENVFVTPYLYTDFAFSFAPSIAAVAYVRAKGRPPVTTTIRAGPSRKARQLALNAMSAHFIAVQVPPRARALELVTAGVDGPDPLQSLLVGVRRGPTRSLKSLRVAREVNPCALSFPPTYGTFVDLISVNFRSDRERKGSVLVVANRTNRPIRYTLSYRTLPTRTTQPSPSVPWGKSGDPNAALCSRTGKQVVTQGGSDSATDTELGAPELTDLVVNLVTTPSNSRPLVTFAVDIPNRRELQLNDIVSIAIDTDRNAGTGCAPYGAEREFLVGGVPTGPDVAGIGRCVGREMKYAQDGTYQVRYDENRRRLLVLTTPGDLGGATAFNFAVVALWKDLASNEVRIDAAPDLPYVACFPSCAGGRIR
jgi:hypothetical protein